MRVLGMRHVCKFLRKNLPSSREVETVERQSFTNSPGAKMVSLLALVLDV